MIRGPKPAPEPKRCLYCNAIIEDSFVGRKKKFCNQQHGKAYWDDKNKKHKLEYDREYSKNRRRKMKEVKPV